MNKFGIVQTVVDVVYNTNSNGFFQKETVSKLKIARL
jgi:hypothetical protein